jgi:GAF domain-containing protein
VRFLSPKGKTMADELEDRSSDELLRVYMRMSGILLSEETLQSSLDLVCSMAEETISGTDGAGVTLARNGRTYTAAYTDGELVQKADEIQYQLDEGPCISALREKTTFRIDSMSNETRWPRWAPEAAALGIASSVSVPLLVRDQAIGATKVYSSEENHYEAWAERVLKMFADQAAIVLANAADYSGAKEMAEQLKVALETRDTIGMAKGILILQEGVDEEGAFDMLRNASQHENIKLREIARQLIDRTVGRGRD